MADLQSASALVAAWRQGDSSAKDQLWSLLYPELRRLAASVMGAESRRDHTLEPTALVNEAYLRLAGSQAPLEDKAHFKALAGRVMRNVLVDHARAKRRRRRGSGRLRVTLDLSKVETPARPPEMLDLHRAVEALAAKDQRKAEAVVLQVFGGLTQPEISRVLGVSLATVERDLRFGRAWVARLLRHVGSGPGSSG